MIGRPAPSARARLLQEPAVWPRQFPRRTKTAPATLLITRNGAPKPPLLACWLSPLGYEISYRHSIAGRRLRLPLRFAWRTP